MSVLSLSLVGTAARVALVGVTLTIAVVVARVLGPAGLGQFFLFVQVVAILAVVADAGISQGVAAFFGRDDDANRYRYGIVLRVLPISAAVTAVLAGAILGLGYERILPHFPGRLLRLAFVALPFLLYSNVWTSMMAGMGRIREASTVQLAGSVLWLLLTAVFVAGMNGGVLAACVVYCAALVAQAVLMGAMAARLVGSPSLEAPSPDAGREFLLFAAMAFPGAIGYLLMIRLPVFILNGFHGPASAGIFSAAQQIVERTLLPIVAVQAAAYEAMVKATRSAATAAINRYARLCAAGMGVTVLGGIVFAGPIVRLLLGDEYAQAASVCRLLFPGALFMTCALVLDAFFLNQLGRPGTLSILAAIEVVLVMGSGFLLVPRWGPNGAAVSLTLTEVAGTLVYLRWHITATGTKLREVTLVTRADLQDVGRRSTAALARVRRR